MEQKQRKIRRRTYNIEHTGDYGKEFRDTINKNINKGRVDKDKEDLKRFKNNVKYTLSGFCTALIIVGGLFSIKPIMDKFESSSTFTLDDTRIEVPLKNEGKRLSVYNLNYFIEDFNDECNPYSIYNGSMDTYNIFIIKIDIRDKKEFDINGYKRIVDLFKQHEYGKDLNLINSYIHDGLISKESVVNLYRNTIQIRKTSSVTQIIFKFAREK